MNQTFRGSLIRGSLVAVLFFFLVACSGGQGGSAIPPDGDVDEPPPSGGAPSSAVLEAVKDRGTLRCGVNGGLPGFGLQNPDGTVQGFDADLCRAVAASVLGDADAVSFRTLSAAERFDVLADREVDIVSRNVSTWHGDSPSLRVAFGPTTFYDGSSVLARASLGINSFGALSGRTLCYATGSRIGREAIDRLAARGINVQTLTFPSTDEVWSALVAERCDGVVSDVTGLISRSSLLERPEDYAIIPDLLEVEPLAPMVRDDDAGWLEVVTRTMYGLMSAEALGVTSENVASLAMGSADEDVNRLLGATENAMPQIGLPRDAMVHVIRGVGNYAEIFDRHLGANSSFEMQRGPNALAKDGGMLDPPPFR